MKTKSAIQERINALKPKPKLKLLPKKAATKSAAALTSTDLKMFAGFNIPATLVEAAGIRRVTDTEARRYGIVGRPNQNMQGLMFPYLDAKTGDIDTARIRRDHPEIKNGKPDAKYICPKNGHRRLYFPPGAAELLEDPAVPIALVEAEKSSLALAAWSLRTVYPILPLAMGGCAGWLQNNGKGKESTPLADLDVCNGRHVIVMLDSNVATNPAVQDAQEALVAELRKPERKCLSVTVCTLPQADNVNGPDDLLALFDGDARMTEVLAATTAPAALGRYSDDEVALTFTARYSDDLRYVAPWGQWFVWDGLCWKRDDTLDVYSKAREVCRTEAAECGKKQIAQRIRSAQTVAAVERLARADRRHAATTGQWDADPWLLNTPGGAVDLRTGTLRPATREDYFTKTTGATPGGGCPLWTKVLDEVTAGDKELQSYLQRTFGYILTGKISEHALFFLYGTGANGKSVVVNTVAGILGDYARVAPIETFTATRNEAHPTDLAGLQGARLVTATETEDGKRWNESKLKDLTGGDRIAARFMRQDFFEFTPQFKLVVSGNHRPGLRNVDEAMRRRMNLVPFSVTIPPAKRDRKLTEKLRAEWGGILRWMIEGCLAWQRLGLAPPKAVSAATDSYLAAEDALGRWLEEGTVAAKNGHESSTELFQFWRRWAEGAGEFVGSQKRFSQNLEARGYVPAKRREGNGFIGLKLLRGVEDVEGRRVIPVESFPKTNSLQGEQVFPPHPPHARRFTRAGRATINSASTVKGRLQ